MFCNFIIFQYCQINFRYLHQILFKEIAWTFATTFFKKIIYLRELYKERKRDIETATMVKSRSCWSQEPHQSLLHEEQGPKYLNHFYCFSRRLAKSFIRSGAATTTTSTQMGYQSHHLSFKGYITKSVPETWILTIIYNKRIYFNYYLTYSSI